jgi:hypothetical protein
MVLGQLFAPALVVGLWWGLAGVNDNVFWGLLNGSYPNDWFIACVMRWFRQRFGKAPICHKQ